MKPSSAVTSSEMAGFTFRKRPMIEGRITRATTVGTFSFRVPVGTVAQFAHLVERAGNLPECRLQALEQPHAGFRRCYTAGRAVEEPHIEFGFEPPQRFAQRRSGNAPLLGGSAKAALARNGGEGIEVGREEDRSLCEMPYGLF